MLTNFSGNVYPYIYSSRGFVPEEDYRTGPGRNLEEKNLWSNHAICMEGESENDDAAPEPAFNPHMHLIHLIS